MEDEESGFERSDAAGNANIPISVQPAPSFIDGVTRDFHSFAHPGKARGVEI
ncbi:hypothetical protein AB8A20_02535 [Tardiphaga sp. 604_B6_N1_1]|jgi:hypothetical protein|uniref:hypothetical protein n=1 Tax=unclassified Tardiphaga TaxID=2631404 RepID=UPI003F215289